AGRQRARCLGTRRGPSPRLASIAAGDLCGLRHRDRRSALRIVRGRVRHRLARARQDDVRRADGSRHLSRDRLRRDGRQPARGWNVDWRSAAGCGRPARARGGGRLRRTGLILLAVVMAAAIAAPLLAPNDPNRRFPDLQFAPPTRLHVFGERATLYIYPQRLVSRRERKFENDRSRPVAVRPFSDGRLMTTDAEAGSPLLLLGADGYGRDIFSRLLYGGRATLAVALIATVGAALFGMLIGGVAGGVAG